MTKKKQNESTSVVDDEKLVSSEEKQTIIGSNEEIKVETIETESLVTANNVIKTRH